MKIKLKEKEFVDDASIPNLLTCEIKYEIKDANGSIGYVGPKIPPELWYQITSFFKWTYDTAKSESQVRLFVSPTLGQWKAHAFPQEAKSGMTTTELDNDDSKAQRAAMGLNPPDWFLFGTVHHHCGMGAFASGTDEDNERNQDGLHMTVGRMNCDNYELHARLYRRGLRVDPDMSWFWDIGNIVDSCPEVFRQFIPKNYPDLVARKMMCISVVTDFPQQWKDNYIEIKKPEIVTTYPQGSGSQGFPGSDVPAHYSSEHLPAWKRAQNAWKEIIFKATTKGVEASDLVDALADLNMESFPYHMIAQACLHHRIDLVDLERQHPLRLEDDIAMSLLEMQADEEIKKNGLAALAGKPEGADTSTTKAPTPTEGGDSEIYSIT